MGLTENTATALLALNGLDVRPNSAVSVEGMEAGLVGEDQKVAVLAPVGISGRSPSSKGRVAPSAAVRSCSAR